MAKLREYAKHRQTNGRYFMVQRQFKELGSKRIASGLRDDVLSSHRIARSSGTDDPKVFDAINDMLTRLAISAEMNDDALTLLAKLQTGRVRFLEALRDFETKGFDGIRKYGEDDAPIDADAFKTWLAGHDVQDSTRRTYLASYTTMMKFAGASDTMRDIPEILQRYKAYCVRKKKNFRAWNYCLAIMEAWTRTIVGKRSDVYEALTELDRFSLKKHHRNNRYFSPAEVKAICAKMPFDVGAMCWTMCLTGMGPKEMMVDGFDVEGKGIHIHGEKTDHRDRIVPMVEKPATVSDIHYKTLRQWVVRASGGTMKPYDFRRTYARWMLNAGVPYNRVQMYQGHAPQDQTLQYAYSETQQFLTDDADKMRTWLKSELAKQVA